MNPSYKKEFSSTESRKRVKRNHFWQTLTVSLGGILIVLLIVSLTGISLPETTLIIDMPYTANDSTKSVCVTFARNADKHWIDEDAPDRTGAQFDKTIAKEYPNVTVLFTDIVGFTQISGGMKAEEVVTMLNKIFTMFDERAQREGIEKIKTIGDSYMAAAGLTSEQDNDGAAQMVRLLQV